MIKKILLPRGLKAFAKRKANQKQDLNNKNATLSREELSSPMMLDLLQDLDIDVSRVKDACFMDLVQNVMPHDDKRYCSDVGVTKATMIENKEFDRNKYYDTPISNEFYFNDKDWVAIKAEYAYTFDPRKTHAILNNSRILVLVLFYK